MNILKKQTQTANPSVVNAKLPSNTQNRVGAIGGMLRFRSRCNGVRDLSFIHSFRQLLLYSTSISTEENPNFVNYLVECLGFSRQQALLTSNKLAHTRLAQGVKKFWDFDFAPNAESVVTYFKKIGLEQYHIRNAVVSQPRLLFCRVEKTLKPKIEVLQKFGLSGSDIAGLLSHNPSIFHMGLNTAIVPSIEALKEIMGCERHVISLLKMRNMRLAAVPKLLVPNVALLRSYGVPIESIRKFLLRESFTFFRNTEFLQDAVIRVEEKLGIPRNSSQFLAGIGLVTSLKEETIESKTQILKSFGWTSYDIKTLISSNPMILKLSKDSIRKKLDFLMNELGYEPSYLAHKLVLFSCSLEKRVMPRHKVLSILKENGLIRMNYALSTALFFNESEFLKKFVLPFKEVHEVYSKLKQ